MCFDTVSIITDINDTEVEKTAPEKEFADITQRLRTIGIAAVEKTFVVSTQFLILSIQDSIDPTLIIINAIEKEE